MRAIVSDNDIHIQTFSDNVPSKDHAIAQQKDIIFDLLGQLAAKNALINTQAAELHSLGSEIMQKQGQVDVLETRLCEALATAVSQAIFLGQVTTLGFMN